MRRGLALAAVLAVLGSVLGGAEARSRPRAPVAAPVVRLVLGPAETPGLKVKRASAALGAKAVAKALRPAHPPKPRGKALASHLARREAELWSLAYVLKSGAAAKTQLQAFLQAVRRAGLRPIRAPIGEEGWLIAAQRGRSRKCHSRVMERRGAATASSCSSKPIAARCTACPQTVANRSR